jgi:hypothetical protein
MRKKGGGCERGVGGIRVLDSRANNARVFFAKVIFSKSRKECRREGERVGIRVGDEH